MLTRGDVGMQRGPDGGRYRIDRMSLRPAVLMIHQETLIVAFDKTRPHQLGHGPADRRHARIPNALADLRFHDPFSFSRVGRQLALRGERRPHLAGGRATLMVPRPARRSEEHTSELQSLMSISYAASCLTKTT